MMTNSVAVATYNGEKFICELLSSMLTQTKKLDEIVVVDDMSKDGTVKVVKEFIEKNNAQSLIKLYVNEKNLGYAENYRKAIGLTSGDIVYLADQDDIWVNDRVEKMSAVMEDNEGVGLMNTDYACFYEDVNDLTGYFESDVVKLKNIPLNAKNRFLKFPGCVMAIRKSFYEEIKGYWHVGWAHDEFLWCVSVLLNRCYYYKYCSLKRRVHEGQTSGKVGKSLQNRISYLEGEILAGQKLYEISKEKGFDKKTQDFFLKNKQTTEYRLELVRDKRKSRIFPLLFRLKYYASKKAYLRELIIGFKG